jgi:hypothetical protein
LPPVARPSESRVTALNGAKGEEHDTKKKRVCECLVVEYREADYKMSDNERIMNGATDGKHTASTLILWEHLHAADPT